MCRSVQEIPSKRAGFFFFFWRGIIGWLLLFIFANLVERVSLLEIYNHS